MAEKEKGSEQQDFGLWLVIIITLLIFFGLIFQGGILGTLNSSDFEGDLVVEPSSVSSSFLGGHLWQKIISVWKGLGILFVFLDILLLIGIAYLLHKGGVFSRKPSFREKPTSLKVDHGRKIDKEIQKLWQKVEALAKGGSKESVRLAVMEGDALVDLFLKKYGFDGETMADRLKKVPSAQALNLEALWAAHKLRNELVHTAGRELSDKEAQVALTSFRDFLINMGVL